MSEARVTKCSAAEIFDDPESAGLFAEYERECANPMLGPCAPRREIYAAVERTGAGQCFAAWLDGKLCGFAFVLMTALPHYGRRFATVESPFVARVARRCGLGWRLMQAVENYCREAGFETVSYCAPTGSRLDRLLSLSGGHYLNTHKVYCRRLG